jgi:hypothetical protein
MIASQNRIITTSLDQLPLPLPILSLSHAARVDSRNDLELPTQLHK